MHSSLLLAAVAVLFTALAPRVHGAELLLRDGQTVAFLGDSITQQGAESSGGYVRLVERGLAVNGVVIKVIPAGIGGNKSNQMRERLDGQVLRLKPDWMTLSCGVNDVWHGVNGVSLADYKINITDIVERCEKAGTRVLILTATQINLPVDNPPNTKLAEYNAFLRELATQRKLPLADLNADMAAEQKALAAAGITRPLTVDGVHMNAYGNQMMARGVLRSFGLDDKQMQKAVEAWRALPDAVPLTAKLKISLPELEVLERLAAVRKQSIDQFLADQLGAALKSTLAETPPAASVR